MSALDTKFKFSQVIPISNDPTQLNNEDEYISFSNKRAMKQRFGFDLTLRKTKERIAMEFYAFVVSLGGRGGIFDLPNPMKKLGNAADSVVCRAVNAVGKGQSQILVDGFSSNFVEPVVVGEFIRPINNKKCYLVTAVSDVDENGRMTIGVYPQLYNAVSGNEVIQISKQVVFQVRLESDEHDILWAARNADNADMSIDVIEAENG